MKLILRKENSSTSVLLFLFNVYLIKTNRDYIKLSNLIEFMKPFGKNETTTRMALSRAIKIGLLINSRQDNEVFYSLTSEGKEYIMQWQEWVRNLQKRYKLRNSEWNNKWYSINIEFNNNKSNKALFIEKLEENGFVQINTNIWLSPYKQQEIMEQLADRYDLLENLIETYGEMKIHKEMKKFLEEVYDLQNLRNLYQQFINTSKDKLIEIKELCKEPSFVDSGAFLPMLQKVGFKFFNIASLDAVLPKQLLPEWEGDKAALLLLEIRQVVFEAMHRYFNKFN